MTPCLGSSIVGYQSRPVVSRLEKKLVRSLRISARFGKACQQRLPKSSPRRRRLASPSWSSNTFAGRPRAASTSQRCTLRRRAPCCQRSRANYTPDSDRKSTRLNSSHSQISYAVFCLKKKKKKKNSVITNTELLE